jgi:hypothetical protein
MRRCIGLDVHREFAEVASRLDELPVVRGRAPWQGFDLVGAGGADDAIEAA